MHIITGATGHVGSAVAESLLKQGEKVLVITRSREKAENWKQKGAEAEVVDINDTETLHEIFKKGKRVFLLNPPAPPDTDTVKEEKRSLQSLLKALENTKIEKVVAESTYGAQPGEGNGDLNVLYEMEQRLEELGIPATIIRGAYYMSNWDMQLETAKKDGKVHTLYPIGLKIPMADPHDIGEFAARLMMEPVGKTGLHYVEGPQPYSSADVAEALSEVLRKPVEAVETPQRQWIPTLRNMGFSEKAAKSMANMTNLTLEQKFEMPDEPYRGRTTLKEYVQKLAKSY